MVILAYPSVYVHLLEVVPVLQVPYSSHNVFHSGEAALLCLRGLVEGRVPREVVIYFGQRNQRDDVGALNGDTASEILKVDIERERFVDSLEMQGEGPDEIPGRLGPLGSLRVYGRGVRKNFLGW